MVAVEEGFVLVGDNFSHPRARRRIRRSGLDVWHADRDGRFTRPPSYVNVDGGPLGMSADGSLVMWTYPETSDTTIVTEIVCVATQVSSRVAEGQQAEVLFRIANPRDPDRHEFRNLDLAPGARNGIAGDTIWVLPTERPELVAVHPSGGVCSWLSGMRGTAPCRPGRHPIPGREQGGSRRLRNSGSELTACSTFDDGSAQMVGIHTGSGVSGRRGPGGQARHSMALVKSSLSAHEEVLGGNVSGGRRYEVRSTGSSELAYRPAPAITTTSAAQRVEQRVMKCVALRGAAHG